MVLNVHRYDKAYWGRREGGGVWRWGEREIRYLSLHCHHRNDSCIKMGSGENHVNVWLIVKKKVTRQCPQTTTFWRERRAEAVSNRGPSAYQPNALPLGQTGSQEEKQSREKLRVWWRQLKNNDGKADETRKESKGWMDGWMKKGGGRLLFGILQTWFYSQQHWNTSQSK